MSNKIVPSIYRAVIDDVVAQIKTEFDEFGVAEQVLADLQRRWEEKIMASGVADFNPAPLPQPSAAAAPQLSYNHPPHPLHAQYHSAYATPHLLPVPGQQSQVKSEPVENRSILSNPYGIPSLPGPQMSARHVPPGPAVSYSTPVNGRPSSAAGQAPPPPTARYHPPPVTVPPQAAAPARIPQVDGPSSSSSESPSPPPSQGYAPRASHPSLPQPSQISAATKADDSEAINSDLDDSDSDNEQEGAEGNAVDTDIVFCTYDKVARVKNKWKCVLKDGMIHINGKDYLFAKCNGEFEW